MQSPALEVRNLDITFFLKKGPLKVVDAASFRIDSGEILGLVGESGCGKSVTSRSLMRLVDEPGQITQGEIFFKGRDLLRLSEQEMRDIRGREISMIFQDPMSALNPVLTIGEQIKEQILRHQTEKSIPARLANQKAAERTQTMLSLVGISPAQERMNSYPHQLSGGQRQRAMIAMALSCNPSLLIADEPTTSLDVTIQAQILELIQSLQEQMNMTTLFITHDLGLVSEIADRVIVMYAGQICEEAPTSEIFSNPRHPYTLALIESRPRFGHQVERLKTIHGRVPRPDELTGGCPFSNRCPQVQSECHSLRPPLVHLDKTQHRVACFNPVGVSQ